MHSLATLLLTVAAACAIARPGPSIPPEASPVRANGAPPRSYLNDFILPRLIMPRYFGLEESPRVMMDQREIQHDWLDKEIDRISEMAEVEEALRPYEMDTQWIPPMPYRNTFGYRPRVGEVQKQYAPSPIQSTMDAVNNENQLKEMGHDSKKNTTSRKTESTHLQEQNKSFALTPLDDGYFDETGVNIEPQQASELHEGGGSIAVELQLPRQIRQNPNLSKSRTLVSENIDQIRSALANKDYSRLPVSLLPTNLRWLNINQRKDDESQEGPEGSSKPGHGQVQVSEATDPADSIYGVAIIAAVGSSLAIAIVGFAFGWYTLSKKAKAAADVDYPAYGVTGPTIDSSGDRRLAHSAHMYHYQHQKQQIIAMERNGMDHGTGSVSDPESEEENEEGDYTVYECPGFASTGDIEVQNPLFSDDPTPATPGKCEIVKPQPKE